MLGGLGFRVVMWDVQDEGYLGMCRDCMWCAGVTGCAASK